MRGASGALVAPLFIAVLLLLVGLGVAFDRSQQALGRFAVPGGAELPERLDPDWLATHLFDLAPEEVGTLWDGKVGPPEVAAVLARLVAEGKLQSRVQTARTLGLWERSVLHLTRLPAGREGSGYEKKLLDGLFVDGTDETDTDRIRKHYRSTGFDPAGLIRSGIEARLHRRPGLSQKTPAPRKLPALVLLGLGLALLALEAGRGRWRQLGRGWRGRVVGAPSFFQLRSLQK